MLYFSMLNTAGAKRKKTGSLFATRKNGVHGFGLRRAEAILEEHGGWVKYNSEDGAFTSEFVVPAAEWYAIYADAGDFPVFGEFRDCFTAWMEAELFYIDFVKKDGKIAHFFAITIA